MNKKPPMIRPKQLSKSKTIKNDIEEDDNKENTLPKALRQIPTKKPISKDIAGSLAANTGIAVNMLKRHSFAKENLKDSIYIKKTPSAKQINRSGKERQGGADSYSIASAEGSKQQKKNNYSLEKKAIGKIAYQKVLSLRSSNLKTPAQVNSQYHDNDTRKNSHNLNLSSSQVKEQLYHIPF